MQYAGLELFKCVLMWWTLLYTRGMFTFIFFLRKKNITIARFSLYELCNRHCNLLLPASLMVDGQGLASERW